MQFKIAIFLIVALAVKLTLDEGLTYGFPISNAEPVKIGLVAFQYTFIGRPGVAGTKFLSTSKGKVIGPAQIDCGGLVGTLGRRIDVYSSDTSLLLWSLQPGQNWFIERTVESEISYTGRVTVIADNTKLYDACDTINIDSVYGYDDVQVWPRTRYVNGYSYSTKSVAQGTQQNGGYSFRNVTEHPAQIDTPDFNTNLCQVWLKSLSSDFTGVKMMACVGTEPLSWLSGGCSRFAAGVFPVIAQQSVPAIRFRNNEAFCAPSGTPIVPGYYGGRSVYTSGLTSTVSIRSLNPVEVNGANYPSFGTTVGTGFLSGLPLGAVEQSQPVRSFIAMAHVQTFQHLSTIVRLPAFIGEANTFKRTIDNPNLVWDQNAIPDTFFHVGSGSPDLYLGLGMYSNTLHHPYIGQRMLSAPLHYSALYSSTANTWNGAAGHENIPKYQWETPCYQGTGGGANNGVECIRAEGWFSLEVFTGVATELAGLLQTIATLAVSAMNSDMLTWSLWPTDAKLLEQSTNWRFESVGNVRSVKDLLVFPVTNLNLLSQLSIQKKRSSLRSSRTLTVNPSNPANVSGPSDEPSIVVDQSIDPGNTVPVVLDRTASISSMSLSPAKSKKTTTAPPIPTGSITPTGSPTTTPTTGSPLTTVTSRMTATKTRVIQDLRSDSLTQSKLVSTSLELSQTASRASDLQHKTKTMSSPKLDPTLTLSPSLTPCNCPPIDGAYLVAADCNTSELLCNMSVGESACGRVVSVVPPPAGPTCPLYYPPMTSKQSISVDSWMFRNTIYGSSYEYTDFIVQKSGRRLSITYKYTRTGLWPGPASWVVAPSVPLVLCRRLVCNAVASTTPYDITTSSRQWGSWSENYAEQIYSVTTTVSGPAYDSWECN